MRLIWTSDLETGIRQIDLQHQELIEIINEFETAFEAGDEGRAMDDLLPRLAAYVAFHFATEEAMIPGVPGGAAHKALHTEQHNDFSERLMKLKSMPGHELRREMMVILEYLKQWLVDHIMKTDKQLARLIVVRIPVAD
ncbi:MAG: bacteriohemerythrin [Rhodocyclaceae bacterium]